MKFSPAGRNRPIARGGMNAAAGMRLWTFRIADEAALTARFVQHGYPAPAFTIVGDIRTALVADPDGELVLTFPRRYVDCPAAGRSPRRLSSHIGPHDTTSIRSLIEYSLEERIMRYGAERGTGRTLLAGWA